MPELEAWRTTPDPLSDFEVRSVQQRGEARRVFIGGQGPAVVVMTEMPGISPEVARFARFVRDAGFTVWMPDLFGEAGRPATPLYSAREVVRACIAREFRAFAANASSPITAWLRALAAHAFEVCGGRGVGAIGMCFTGNFAMSMMLEPSVLAPVLCQPSLPILQRGGLHMSPDEVDRVRARLERDDLTALAYRFEGDAFCRRERFDDFEKAFGGRFHARTLPDSAAHPAARMANPHSVVTQHLIDEAGQPTRLAVDEILAFFRDRLRP